MTVTKPNWQGDVTGEWHVTCTWFNPQGEKKSDAFPPDSLERASEPTH